MEIVDQYYTYLIAGNSARTLNVVNDECVIDLNLLTKKPVLYVCNVDEVISKR